MTYTMIIVIVGSLDLLLRLAYGEVSRSPSEIQGSMRLTGSQSKVQYDEWSILSEVLEFRGDDTKLVVSSKVQYDE